MAGGKAYGQDRQYQVECRDVLMSNTPELTPWEGDGIDVQFKLLKMRWTFDVALRNRAGALVVAECRRTGGTVKQEHVGDSTTELNCCEKS
jgi:hypothetical protein